MNTTTDHGLAWNAPTATVPLTLKQLRLQVSLDEKQVFLGIALSDGRQLDLGQRSHHYCLLTLARQRFRDVQRGVDCSDQGWLERSHLSGMLGINIGTLNIQIHRVCQQITLALPHGVQIGEVIERRRDELRFGALPFCIVRGSNLESEFLPVHKPV